MEVEDDLRESVRTGCVRAIGGTGALGLVWGVVVQHGVRHELDEVDGEFFSGLVALDVLGEGCGGVQHGLETVVLGSVLFRGEGAVLFEDEPGYGFRPYFR